MRSLFLSIIIISTSTVFANEMNYNYRQVKKLFRKASKIQRSSFESKIKNKTYKCVQAYSDGESFINFRFSSHNGKNSERFSGGHYTFNKTLILREGRTSSTKSTTEVKMYADGSLAMKEDHLFKSYIYCPASEILEGKNESRVIKLPNYIDSLAITKSGLKVVIDSKNMLTVYDKNFNKLRSISALDFFQAAGETYNYNSFPYQVKLKAIGEELYFYGNLYDGKNFYNNKLYKFDIDLKSIRFINVPYSLATFETRMNGDLSLTATVFNSETRVHSVEVSSYDNNLNLLSTITLPKLMKPTSTQLTNGNYIASSYCDYKFQELYSCKNRNFNYEGLSILNNKGEFIKFISEFDTYFGMPKVIWTQALSSGDFLVAYKSQTSAATIFKYDSSGNYLNSWGNDARNPLNRALTILNSAKDLQLTLVNDEVFYYQNDTIYKTKL